MICPSCQRTIATDAIFCPYCGVSLHGSVPSTEGFCSCIVVTIAKDASYNLILGLQTPEKKEITENNISYYESMAETYDATINRLSSNSIGIFFSGDDSDQEIAIKAASLALAIKTTTTDFDEEAFKPKIGIDMGEIAHSDLGPFISEKNQSPLDNALRLASKAIPGNIVVSENIADNLNSQYRINPIGFFQMRGNTEPLKLFELLSGPSEIDEPENEPEYQFIGHENELELLNELLQSIAAKKSAVALSIEGTYGSGKTVIIRKAAEIAEQNGWNIVSCDLSNSTMLEPIYIIRQIVATFRNHFDKAVDEFLPYQSIRNKILYCLGYGSFDTNKDGAESVKPILEKIILSTVRNASLESPTLILIDDLHWADVASTELINRMVSELNDTPLVIITTYNADLGGKNIPQTIVSLPGLDEDTALKIFNASNSDDQLAVDIFSYCLNYSRGVIGHFVELIRLFQLDPSKIDYSTPLDFLESAKGIISERYRLLNKNDKAVLTFLRAVSIPVNELDLKSLFRESGFSNRIEFTVSNLTKQGFLHRFVSNGEILYKLPSYLVLSNSWQYNTNEEENSNLALTYLEGLNAHYDAIKANIYINLKRYTDASRSFFDAADKAILCGAYYDAIVILSTALETLSKNENSGAVEHNLKALILEKRADVYILIDVLSTAIEDYDQALLLADQTLDIFLPIGLKKVKLMIETGELDEALSELEWIKKQALDAGVDNILMQIEEAFGDLYTLAIKPELIESHYRRAIKSCDVDEDRQRVYLKLGGAMYKYGRAVSALEDMDRAFQIAERTGSYKMIADAALALGNLLPDRLIFDRAIYLSEIAVSKYKRISDVSGQASAYINMAYIALLQTDIEEFDNFINLANELASRANNTGLSARCYWLLAYSEIISGDKGNFDLHISHRSLRIERLETLYIDVQVDLLKSKFSAQVTRNYADALELAQNSYQKIITTGISTYVTECQLSIAEALYGLGLYNEARHVLNHPDIINWANVTSVYQIEYYRLYGLILVETGKVEEGNVNLQSALTICKENQLKFYEGMILLDMAPYLDGKKPVESIDKAIWLFDEIGTEFWKQRAVELKNSLA